MAAAQGMHAAPRVRADVVGNPLRPARELERGRAARELGLDASRPVVVVVGGSRGARRLNDAALAAGPALHRGCRAQTVIVAGRADADRVAREATSREGVVVMGLNPHAGEDGRLADEETRIIAPAIALARAGVPAVFVPYPHAADDHQRRNAEPFVEAGGAVCVDDADLTGEHMAAVVRDLLEHPRRREAMASAMRAAARPDAAELAARIILDVVKKNGRRTGAAPESLRRVA